MRKKIILTLSGPDRIGIVDKVVEVLLEYSGNVESSRMARLGGEFVMLMMVSFPMNQAVDLKESFNNLKKEGYQINTIPTADDQTNKYVGWLPYQIEINGADHEGIIHQFAHQLAAQGINIETMDTETVLAPMSGTPLFTMTAIVLVPPELSFSSWRDELEEIGDNLNVDIKVLPYTGSS